MRYDEEDRQIKRNLKNDLGMDEDYVHPLKRFVLYPLGLVLWTAVSLIGSLLLVAFKFICHATLGDLDPFTLSRRIAR